MDNKVNHRLDNNAFTKSDANRSKFWNLYVVILVLLFINGLTVAVINSIIQSSMQMAVSEDMKGKVVGFRRTLSSSLVPMAMAVGGILAEFISIGIIITVGFSVIIVLFLALGFVEDVKEMIDGV